jgi:hypothetical protein
MSARLLDWGAGQAHCFRNGRRNNMAAHVNLDALIHREDFATDVSGAEAPIKQSIQISELEKDAFFYGALRKPDFQRETAEWDPARVVGLIRSFIDSELIPSVILWQNRELLFVIDGSHRLSALIAWVQNDYGDGDRSQDFFDHQIPEEQIKVAQRTRDLVERAFGSYKSHREAIATPTSYGPDIVARARRFGSLTLQLQWVKGDAKIAEASFVRINQQAAMITPQELELIRARAKPNAIAARAIIRRGTGHQYWSSFDEKTQNDIKLLANDIHRLIFDPPLRYPIKSLDLPAGGAVYTATALRMVYDLINLSVGVPSPDDDVQGTRTVEYLIRCRRVMRLLLSNDPSSLGLHPAVYFYSWTGKQQPILFLTMAALIVDFERSKKLPDFIKTRRTFEAFLMANRSLLNQVIRKFGTKSSGTGHLRSFYDDVLKLLKDGTRPEKLVDALRGEQAYAYLQPEEQPYDGVRPTRFSKQVKSGIVMTDLLETAARCKICGGLMPAQAITIDHVVRVSEGGPSTHDNAQLAHPYCNTAIKN